MKKIRWAFVCRISLSALCAAALIAGARQLPADTWAAVGRQTALAAVRLQQTDEAVALFAERLERPTASAAPTAVPTASAYLPALSGEGADQQPLTEPTATAAANAPTVPAEDGTGGKIVSQQLGGGTETAGIHIKNKSGVSADIAAALAADLPFSVECGTDQPQVLIYHTHTTEGYMPYDAGYYNAGDILRDPTYPHNVTLVGDALEAELVAAGIAVIHDTAVYDFPSYRGAYERSVVMMEETLKRYPSVKVTLDLHRDGLMANTTDKLKPTVTLQGQTAAQLMVVCGVLSTDALPHPDWQKNLTFAARLQQRLEHDWPGLARPLSLTGARYNQYMTTGSLLIEMGSDGNTIDEAVRSAHLLGKSLAALFKGEN